MLNTWEDFQDLQERAAGVDILLELSENLRPVPIRFFLRLGDYGLPIILFGSEFQLAPRRLEAAGYWKSRANKVFLPPWVSLTYSNASRLILTLHPTFPAFLERIEIEVKEKRALEFLISREIVEKIQFPHF